MKKETYHIERLNQRNEIAKIQIEEFKKIAEGYENKRLNAGGLSRVAFERIILKINRNIFNVEKSIKHNNAVIKIHESKITL